MTCQNSIDEMVRADVARPGNRRQPMKLRQSWTEAMTLASLQSTKAYLMPDLRTFADVAYKHLRALRRQAERKARTGHKEDITKAINKQRRIPPHLDKLSKIRWGIF